MVKTSFYANKVLLGLSLGAILNANALASQTIDINYTESGSNSKINSNMIKILKLGLLLLD